jgi:hypothetical protein
MEEESEIILYVLALLIVVLFSVIAFLIGGGFLIMFK